MKFILKLHIPEYFPRFTLAPSNPPTILFFSIDLLSISYKIAFVIAFAFFKLRQANKVSTSGKILKNRINYNT